MGRKLLCTAGRKISPGVPKNICGKPTNIPSGLICSKASNGGWVEGMWNNFKQRVYESIERFVQRKLLRKIQDKE